MSNVEPGKASGWQVLASGLYLTVVCLTPAVCWHLVPRDPWWGWVATTILISFSVLLIGGAALAPIMRAPTEEADTPPARDPGPDDPIYAIDPADRASRFCRIGSDHEPHYRYWRSINSDLHGSTWCKGWPR